jgi:ribokinase
MVSRIAVIGSINVDLVTYVERVPAAGETLAAAGFELHHGGKGANQAVAAALLGSDVLMVGKIGTGVFGDEALANLRALGIDASHVTRAAAPTGVASILVEPSGENRIMIVAGANAQLAPEDIDRAAAELARCQMMLLQLEVPLATVYHAIRVAQAHGVPVILNPAPYRDGFSHTSLSGVAFLVPNRVELAQISGQAGIESAARALVREGVHTVIVTLGAAGALIVTHHTSTPIPAVPVEPIDTTGAGDAFIGAFAHFFARTGDVAAAARSAAAYAALATTRRGAQASFADAAEFHAFTPAGTPA